MLKPAVRYGLYALAAVFAAAVVAACLFAWRLSAGPMSMPGLRGPVERVLARSVDGGRASVGQVQAVWFAQERSVGLHLSDVRLDDGRGRPVLRAASVETGLAVDSALVLSPAPGRLTARDFFAAVSVSPKGGYELGYDADGAPKPVALRTLLDSLTGESRRGRPLSFLRRLDLDDGVLVMRQVGGPVAWRGEVETLAFTKADGRIAADARLSLRSAADLARINGTARGQVGLSALVASGYVTGLHPTRVFPAVGFTRRLALVDAPVQANGRLEYALDEGFKAADVTATAGAGRLLMGKMTQALNAAHIVTRYDPKTRQVLLQTVHVDGEKTRLDATGRLWLEPQTDKAPARFEYRLASNESLLTVAPSAAPQRITGFTAQGRFTPAAGEFEVRDARLMLEGAPVRANALLYRGDKPGQSLGLTAAVDVDGVIGPKAVFAFWPEHLGRTARAWVVAHLHEAQVSNTRLRADLPPGQMQRFKLADEMLRIDFDYADAAVSITPTLPRIDHAFGSGVVQGDRFDLTMSRGRLQNVALTEGVIEIPRFKPRGVEATFKARAVGELAEMLEIVDRPPLRLISPTGLSPTRFSGRADMRVEITRPMLKAVPFEDYGVRYVGRLEQGGVTDVGIGLDLIRASLAVEGSLDAVKARGVGRVGPYAGNIDFVSDLKGANAGRKTVVLDGGFSVAGMLSGQGPAGPPFHARLTTRGGDGGAVIRSRVFTGNATWRERRRVVLNGVGEPGAWKDAGLPVGPDLPARTPVRLTMNGSPGNWAGTLDADAYSGHVLLLGLENRRLRYSAEITPDEARRLGLSDMPMFTRTQSVGFEAGLQGRTGWVNYRFGGITGRADWAPGREEAMVYRVRSELDRADLAGLGLPLALAAPIPLDLTAVGQRGGFAGQADVAGAEVRFNVSSPRAGRRAIAFTGEAPATTAVRLGLMDRQAVDGVFGLSGRLDRAVDGRLSGRVEADLTGASIDLLNTAWTKPAGRRGRAFVDLVQRADGATVLSRVVAEGPGLELSGSGVLAKGQVLAFNAPTARIDGFFDGALAAERAENGLQLRVDGRYLDARPLLKRAQASGAGGGEGRALKLNAEIDRVRLNEAGYLREVKASGAWGPAAGRELTIAARAAGGSALNVRAWPDRGGTALDIKVADLGDAVRTLGAFSDLQGGRATATGRLAPGGYDLDLDIRDVRVVRAPAMAQLLTVASLQGMADTLGGDGIHFAHIEAPVKLRGSELTIGQATAKGQALGLTAKGVVDLERRTMDISGSVAPAYALNSAVGVLPVVGPLLVSREGEGVFSLTYTAKGSFERPQVVANPLSLAAPGVLRRVFEEPAPKQKAPVSSSAAD